MKKFFLFTLSLGILIPSFVIAQSIIDQFPQDVQDTINSTPGAREELEKTYNTKLDLGSTGVEEQLSFSVIPSVPRPNQVVTAKIASYSSNLNRLQVSWYVNDILVKKEIGATTHQFVVGDLGTQTKLRISILKSDGTTLEKNYSFRPAEVDLIYEAQTFTPPLYDGKAYFTRQSSIKVSAMPQVLDSAGKIIRPENLVYDWYLDGSLVQSQSGYGKQSFLYQSKVLGRSFRVGVEISSIADGAVANSSIYINPVSPEVLVYEKNPTLGTLYNYSIPSTFSINKPEIEFEAVPYFFKKDSIQNLSTVFDWKLNGSKVNSPNQNSIVFRNEENKEGRASIGVSVSNETILQKSAANFGLDFGLNNKNDFQFRSESTRLNSSH
jgi:hypothetical protein